MRNTGPETLTAAITRPLTFHRRADAAAFDFVLLVVQRPSLLAHFLNFGHHRRLGGQSRLGQPGQSLHPDQPRHFFISHPCQQHLAQRRRVRQTPVADLRRHAHRLRTLHRIDHHHLARVQKAQIHGFLARTHQPFQKRLSQAVEHLLHRFGALQVEHLLGHAITAVRAPVQVAAAFEGRQNAVDGGLGEIHFASQVG